MLGSLLFTSSWGWMLQQCIQPSASKRVLVGGIFCKGADEDTLHPAALPHRNCAFPLILFLFLQAQVISCLSAFKEFFFHPLTSREECFRHLTFILMSLCNTISASLMSKTTKSQVEKGPFIMIMLKHMKADD